MVSVASPMGAGEGMSLLALSQMLKQPLFVVAQGLASFHLCGGVVPWWSGRSAVVVGATPSLVAHLVGGHLFVVTKWFLRLHS